MKENEVVTVTATIETNLRQGEIETEVDSMRGDLAETETSLRGRRGVVGVGRAPEGPSAQDLWKFSWPCDNTDAVAGL